MQKTASNYCMSIVPVLLVLAVIAAPGFGSPITPITPFTDRAAWETAVGGPDWLVDFEGFAVDTSFQISPVDLGPFSLVQVGSMVFHNVVKAGGYADMYTDFGAISVDLTLDTPVYAWGADFTNLDGELLNLELIGGGNAIIEVAQ